MLVAYTVFGILSFGFGVAAGCCATLAVQLKRWG